MLLTLEDRRAARVFQVFPFPFLLDGTRIGDVDYTEGRRRLRSQPVGSDVPNGALWTLNPDPAGDIQYNNNLFTESTAAMVDSFRQALRDTVLAPERRSHWATAHPPNRRADTPRPLHARSASSQSARYRSGVWPTAAQSASTDPRGGSALPAR
jgi:hypothetical protein